ncbi:MAG: prolyl oligopeptidase family serine peptidase [Legionellales bacterium]|nr:prolyl oligopeptidase family serine peptidase [Legionellales bacterium]
MEVTAITYFDGEQPLIGKLFRPDSERDQLPAVILFHAFEGIGEFTENYAKRIAEQGYVVLAADMYGNGETADTIEGCFKLITPFLNNRELVRRRALLAYETLLKQKNIHLDKIGAMGFCFGGMCMLELARSGAKLTAGVSAHGELAASTLPTHPINASLLVLHGYEDPQVPPTRLQAFAEEMKKANVADWMVVFFSHAKHSFTDPASGTYNPQKEQEMGRAYDPVAARRTFKYAIDFFEEKLQIRGV